MGMSAILQSYIGKHQLMAKSTFSMYYLTLYKVFVVRLQLRQQAAIINCEEMNIDQARGISSCYKDNVYL